MSEQRYPVMGQCLRCEAEYFNLCRITTYCRIDDCGGYITGRTHEELKAARMEADDE